MARRSSALMVAICAIVILATVTAYTSRSHAAGETRTLKIYFVHTGEKGVVTFKKDGRYIPAGLKKLNYLLRDFRRNQPTNMDPRLFDLIWEVYRASGSKDYIHVVSGFRSPATNAMLRSRSRSSGVAKKSQHMLGKAMDFYLPDVPLAKLRAIGMKFQVGGVGFYPTSGSPFVHMDVGGVRAWPRMSRDQLVKLFPDGKTLHIPADGKPLPGYQQALADYKRRVGADSIQVAGGAPERRQRSGGGLLAALFGGGGDEDEEPTAIAEAADEGAAPEAPAARAAAPAEATAKASDDTLPAPDVAPLPGVRPAIAEPSVQVAAAEAPAKDDAEPAAQAPASAYPDLLAYAIPVPQLLPDRGAGAARPAEAQPAAAPVVAEASAPTEPGLTAADEPALAMVPVPADRPAFAALKALASNTPVPALAPSNGELAASSPASAPSSENVAVASAAAAGSQSLAAAVARSAGKAKGETPTIARPETGSMVLASLSPGNSLRAIPSLRPAREAAKAASAKAASGKPAARETAASKPVTLKSTVAIKGGRPGSAADKGANQGEEVASAQSLTASVLSRWALRQDRVAMVVKPIKSGRFITDPLHTSDSGATSSGFSMASDDAGGAAWAGQAFRALGTARAEAEMMRPSTN